MQRLWATAATVWAVLGVTAALAWTQSNQAATTATTTTVAATTTGSAAPKATNVSVATAAAPAHATTRTS